MALKLEAVTNVVESMKFSADARDVFGEEGGICLGRLLNGVREFFSVVPPDGLSTTFVFVCWLEGDGLDPLRDGVDVIATSIEVGNVPGYRRHIEDSPVVMVGVRGGNQFDLGLGSGTPSLEELSERALVFVNAGGVDRFVIGGRSTTMPALAVGVHSNFAVPTVASLDEALERYRREAANVACPILAQAWEGGRDGPRLVFANKPESKMRESLGWFLRVRMEEDVCVRPEHNTDDSRPVDLSVDWFGRKQRALIEVKWLGQSLTAKSDGTVFTKFSASRAGEGADQLADYLDRERSTDSGTGLTGYLAVFDGRRRNVVDASTPIALADAEHYRNDEVDLPQKHADGVTGIAGLIRYFLEPRLSQLASSLETA